jgi:cell wall-associated NlpC family hydrolase
MNRRPCLLSSLVCAALALGAHTARADVATAAGATARSDTPAPLSRSGAVVVAAALQAAASSVAPAASAVPPAATAASSAPAGVVSSAGSAVDGLTNFLAAHPDLLTATSAAPVKVMQAVGQRAGDLASNLVLAALNFIGVRYQYGGQSMESGFDCSGFTRYVYQHSLGLALPRRAAEQARAEGTIEVKEADLQPGDLVFFRTIRHAISHVGIYIGDHRFIHAPSPGASIRIEDMQTPYWSRRYGGARRPDGLNTPATPPTPAALNTATPTGVASR